ncbi:MAG: DJ-1/PfpI family protein [Ignavibacteria bacterium]|nr:DJ-1/PfpI family protein [Ignavibacteria bacterium]
MTKTNVLLFLPAQNFNEQEYLIILNALESLNVKIFIASDANTLCVGSNGLKVKNDVQLYNVHEFNFNGLILIGGSGIKSYFNNDRLRSIVKKFAEKRKPTAAICGAPIILAKAGLLKDKATCHIDYKTELEREGVQYLDQPVVANKNIITGQCPSSAPEFIKIFLHELTNN